MHEFRKKILIDFVIGLLVTAGVIALNWSKAYSLPHMLCDGFFVAGVLLMGFGGLKAIRNTGSFDIMSYGLKSALQMNLPWLKVNSPLERKEEDFVAYKERKREERKPATDFLLTGSVFVGLSILCLAIYLAMA